MVGRLKLHEELCEILGNRNVYFNPPESVKMVYPCIRYTITQPDLKRANNSIYKNTKHYDVCVIDSDPDSPIPDLILNKFEYCRWERSYIVDNLNHTILSLYD